MESPPQRVSSHGWRSSNYFIIPMACVALFSQTLLSGFIVPILPYILEVRLRMDPNKTQYLTSVLLGIHGLVSLLSTPFVAHVADNMPNRKIPLLGSSAVCVVGTILMAWTPTLWSLYLGRALQGVASAAIWIVCLALVREQVGEENMGKTMGMSMSFIMAGTVGGPVVSGALIEWLGYWPAWSVPLAVLQLDMIGRAIAILPDQKAQQSGSNDSRGSTATFEDVDTSPLLAYVSGPWTFYCHMIRDPRVIVSMVNIAAFSFLISGMNTTLPLHLLHVFGWGPSAVGGIFFLLQVPSILLGPVAGWTRDRFGLRHFTTISWIIIAIMLILLGIPGNDNFPWASSNERGGVIFTACIAALGIVNPFVRGTRWLKVMEVIYEIEAQGSNILGGARGRSRAMAMGEVAFNIGLVIGPALQGPLSQAIGYLYANFICASILLLVAVASFMYLDYEHSSEDDNQPDN